MVRNVCFFESTVSKIPKPSPIKGNRRKEKCLSTQVVIKGHIQVAIFVAEDHKMDMEGAVQNTEKKCARLQKRL